jgi:hypothetical protein
MEYNPIKIKTNRHLPLERSKALVMQKIGAGNPCAARNIRPRRFAFGAVAAVLFVTLSATAWAANVLGLRDLIGQVVGWRVNEPAGVLELDTEGQTTLHGDAGDDRYAVTLKSMTLSPTELTFSYVYECDAAAVPLPGTLQLRLKDKTKIDAVISEYTDEDGFVKATALLSESVDLTDVSSVLFGGIGSPAQSGSGSFGIVIGVTSPSPER